MTASNNDNETRRENIVLQGLIISELGKSPLYLPFELLTANVSRELYNRYNVIACEPTEFDKGVECVLRSTMLAVLASVMYLREKKLVRLQTSACVEPTVGLHPLNDIYVMLTDLGRADVDKVNEQLKKLEGMDLATAS